MIIITKIKIKKRVKKRYNGKHTHIAERRYSKPADVGEAMWLVETAPTDRLHKSSNSKPSHSSSSENTDGHSSSV